MTFLCHWPIFIVDPCVRVCCFIDFRLKLLKQNGFYLYYLFEIVESNTKNCI